VLDDGRVTDSQGRTVSFKNTIIIMTSNMGSQAILEMGNSDPQRVKEVVMSSVSGQTDR
jgi:ATP-dependent Clp protease ATP-binding subunit ClpB